MALFESKETKSARRQVAIRMGKKKVQKYVGDCRRMTDKYRDMAKKALSAGNRPQCDQYLYNALQYGRQANKWDSFVLRMEDLSIRGQMSGAMSGMVQGMGALVKEIQSGVSVKEMTSIVSELNVAMGKLEQTEEQLTSSMEHIDFAIGTPGGETEALSVSPEDQAEVERMRNELMDEVVVQEKVGDPVAGQTTGPRKAVSKTDERIRKGLDRVAKLKKKA